MIRFILEYAYSLYGRRLEHREMLAFDFFICTCSIIAIIATHAPSPHPHNHADLAVAGGALRL